MSTILFPKLAFRAIGIIAWPVVIIYSYIRVLVGLGDRRRRSETFGIPSVARPAGRLVWLHAVSVGEVLSVIPFILKLRSIDKAATILVTTTTLTSAKIVKERLGDSVIHQFLPFDIFAYVRRFVQFWRPSVVFFVESELWPNMLYYLHEQGIPTYLLNARCSDKSLSRFYIAKKLLRLLPFKLFDAVYVSSQSMLEHVKALGGRTVTLMPSLKTISEKLPVNPESVAKIKRVIGGRKRWIAVSTHPGEEEIIINVHKLLKAAFDDVMTIIAVRHPHRVSDVAELCLRYGLVCTLHSSVLQNDISESANDDIYIVDQMGCLGDFFELVDTVLVCGSLIQNIGGHNFLEPIRFGCNVATGKYFDNFRDVYQHVKRECVIATDTKEICGFVKESFMHFSRDGRTLTNPDFIEKWEDVVRSIMNQLS